MVLTFLFAVLLFEICSYFMMGLNLDAGRFFTYFLLLFTLMLTMNGFFRFCGIVSTSFFVASQLTSLLLILIFIYTGCKFWYDLKTKCSSNHVDFIPFDSMHPWFFWIYYINPLAYAYKAVLINEMKGQVYSCEGVGNAVPYGPGYNDWAHKVCTMKGKKSAFLFLLFALFSLSYL